MSDNIMLQAIPNSPSMQLEQFTGSDCTGSDRAANRVLATTGVSNARGEVIIVVDKQTLRKTTDFTISDDEITFLGNIFNAHKIDVMYVQ